MLFGFVVKQDHDYELAPTLLVLQAARRPPSRVSFQTPAAAGARTVSAQTRQLDFHIPPCYHDQDGKKKQQLLFLCKLQKHEESVKPMFSPNVLCATPGAEEFVM